MLHDCAWATIEITWKTTTLCNCSSKSHYKCKFMHGSRRFAYLIPKHGSKKTWILKFQENLITQREQFWSTHLERDTYDQHYYRATATGNKREIRITLAWLVSSPERTKNENKTNTIRNCSLDFVWAINYRSQFRFYCTLLDTRTN